LLDVGMILQQDAFGTELIATALGNGNGTFQAVRTQTGSSVLENLRISDDLETGDLNGDGTPDLLVFNYASNDVSVFLGNPDGSLRPHQRYGIGNTPQYGTMADFDGDGRIDVAAAIGLPPSGLHNAIVILRNAGTPGPTPTATPTPTPTATPTATPTLSPTATPRVTPRPRPTPRLRPTPVPRP
jgi:FG-GAP-like repeat